MSREDRIIAKFLTCSLAFMIFSVSAKVNMYNFTGVKMYNRLP